MEPLFHTKIAGALVITAIFCSCGKTTHKSKEMSLQTSHGKTPEKSTVTSSHEYYKQSGDIPVPVGFAPLDTAEKTANHKALLFSLEGGLSLKKVTSFYNRELELQGWNMQDLSATEEGLFFCHKPTKKCAISVRPSPNHHAKTAIHIFVQNQTQASDVPDNLKATDINSKSIACFS